jgi:hypothetical protein
MWSFSRFVRQSVADYKPWVRFARDILTASGNTLETGAANYFVLHKDVTDLNETTAVTFLGMSITCARCHNHPLEKWTQDQYWSMANLFARVTLKNGDRPNSVSVQAQPFGDVLHPRREIAMLPTPRDAKPLPLDSPADRRAYFADWLTSPDNPYFAKALVNRVWRNFLGRGLVEAEDDLRQTNPPSNAELFDALAKDSSPTEVRRQAPDPHRDDLGGVPAFVAAGSGQRGRRPLPRALPDSPSAGRGSARRLQPGDRRADGVHPGADRHDGRRAAVHRLPARHAGVATGGHAGRVAVLESFGRPGGQSCSCERQQDASVGQALHLNNGRTLNDKLRAKGSRVEQWVGEKVTDDEAVKRVFRLTLCREPGSGDLKKFTSLMAEAAADGQTPRRAILEDLFWAVLTSREFLFNR